MDASILRVNAKILKWNVGCFTTIKSLEASSTALFKILKLELKIIHLSCCLTVTRLHHELHNTERRQTTEQSRQIIENKGQPDPGWPKEILRTNHISDRHCELHCCPVKKPSHDHIEEYHHLLNMSAPISPRSHLWFDILAKPETSLFHFKDKNLPSFWCRIFHWARKHV